MIKLKKLVRLARIAWWARIAEILMTIQEISFAGAKLAFTRSLDAAGIPRQAQADRLAQCHRTIVKRQYAKLLQEEAAK